MASLYGEFEGIKIVVEDEDDNIFFRTAKMSGSKIIISKDAGVLNVKKYDDIRVVEPNVFLKIFPKLK